MVDVVNTVQRFSLETSRLPSIGPSGHAILLSRKTFEGDFGHHAAALISPRLPNLHVGEIYTAAALAKNLSGVCMMRAVSGVGAFAGGGAAALSSSSLGPRSSNLGQRSSNLSAAAAPSRHMSSHAPPPTLPSLRSQGSWNIGPAAAASAEDCSADHASVINPPAGPCTSATYSARSSCCASRFGRDRQGASRNTSRNTTVHGGTQHSHGGSVLEAPTEGVEEPPTPMLVPNAGSRRGLSSLESGDGKPLDAGRSLRYTRQSRSTNLSLGPPGQVQGAQSYSTGGAASAHSPTSLPPIKADSEFAGLLEKPKAKRGLALFACCFAPSVLTP